jgi:eukaryotic-like serine/threonine-protein kinase
MALAVGTRLGPYEILSAIGAGGMGEVYRAHDSKLGRDVAIKVLPQAFARDADRMARFQREAKVLASLNHPNIASIYGLEDSGATHALVMELVEGPTLAERIKQGPIPIDEALRIAKQICEALEYAHERGIVHRDLKPANGKVTPDDAVKVLDFGLAKALEGDASSIDIANSPTVSRLATQAGVLLGTAAYMSPEQAKGRPVDRRADIWAFGCVLYEMLTGQMAFHGESVTDTLAAVIRAEPDWSQLPAATPGHVRVLLNRCLQKDARRRLRDIGDARIALEEVISGESESAISLGAPAAGWRRALPWALLGVAVIAVAAFGWAYLRIANNPAPAANAVRFQIPLNAKPAPGGGRFTLSPDGRQLAFAAIGSDSVPRLWVRPMDTLEARPLPGSESPEYPPFFWSLDSRYIAFDAGGKLEKIDISGGPAQTVCDLGAKAIGGSWSKDGVIIFGSVDGGLSRVSANGGTASPLTLIDSSRKDIYHSYPSFLPDGRHFIYFRQSAIPEDTGVFIGSLDAKPEEQDLKRLLATDIGPAYAPSADPEMGHVLFMRDGTLLAQALDTRRLELSGEPVTVADHVGVFINGGFFSASANDILVYMTSGGAGTSQLTWFDREGKVVGTAGEPSSYYTLSLSPDGTRAAVSQYAFPSTNLAVWVLDLARGTKTRLSYGADFAVDSIWSPDGDRIVFDSNRTGVYDLYEKLANGEKDESILPKSSGTKRPTSWSHDGRLVLYEGPDPKTAKTDLWVLPLEGDKKPYTFLATDFNSSDGQFSPGGRWVAYVSDESGRKEIYVRIFSPDSTVASDTNAKWQISAGGGSEPRWSGDGKELYYLGADGKLMVVEIETSPAFRAEMSTVLFQTPPSALATNLSSWGVTPDGKRFLFAVQTGQSAAPFTVVLNWQAALKK